MLATTSESALAEAFPAVDAGIQPFGSRVLVQIRNPKQRTASGIIIDSCGWLNTAVTAGK